MHQHQITIDTLGVLDLEWGDKWSYLTLSMNGQTLGSFKGKQALLDRQRVTLPDGRELSVQHDGKDLNIWLDGKELLSGVSSGDSGTADYNRAVKAIFAFGILGVVIGLIVLVFAMNFGELNSEIILLVIDVSIFGLILIGLGFWAKHTQSKIPLYIALAIAVVSLVLRFMSGITAGVVIIGYFIYELYKGIRAAPSPKLRGNKVDMDGPLDANI